jgi:hypothetical protein
MAFGRKGDGIPSEVSSSLKPTPFDIETDLPPMPFDERHCRLALALKAAGIPWKPHVGCFVWDSEGHIEVSSPFPGRVYFILNLGHFLKIFGTVDRMVERLTWLPTWHQARLLGLKLEVDPKDVAAVWPPDQVVAPGEELLALYAVLLKKLQDKDQGKACRP